MDAVKKISLIAAAIGALAIQSSAMAADGTLNFTGTIISSGCKINGSANFVLAPDFGMVSASAFSGVNSRANRNVPVILKLTDCPAAGTGANGQSVKIIFSSPGAVLTGNLLPLTPGTAAAPAATGVGIGLWDQSTGNQLKVGGDPVSYAYDAGKQEATLSFVADFQSTATTVTPGVANAVGYIAFDYK